MSGGWADLVAAVVAAVLAWWTGTKVGERKERKRNGPTLPR